MNTQTQLPELLAPLNRLLTPALSLGVGNPLPLTTGIVLLEVTGRSTGQLRRIPLVCSDLGCALAVSTVREDSQWIKNLAATPRAHVWLRGRRRTVAAEVYAEVHAEIDEADARTDSSTRETDWLSNLAATASRVTGLSVALLRLYPPNQEASCSKFCVTQ